MMVASGVDLKTVQTRFGQSDPRLTLGGYADALDERDRDAADLLVSQSLLHVSLLHVSLLHVTAARPARYSRDGWRQVGGSGR